MDDTKLLKTGDLCPCCGQPIKTTDPLLLQLLTRIKAEMEQEAAQ